MFIFCVFVCKQALYSHAFFNNYTTKRYTTNNYTTMMYITQLLITVTVFLGGVLVKADLTNVVTSNDSISFNVPDTESGFCTHCHNVKRQHVCEVSRLFSAFL